MKKDVNLYYSESIDNNWPPDGLMQFQEWLNQKAKEIPQECHESASIYISAIETVNEGPFSSISIHYTREETEEEVTQRKNEERKRERVTRERELVQLRRLKLKYGE